MQSIRPQLTDELSRKERAVDEMGQLLVEWAQLEERLLSRARQLTERNVSVREAIRALVDRKQLPEDVANGLDEVRRIRNTAAHTPAELKMPLFIAHANSYANCRSACPKYGTAV